MVRPEGMVLVGWKFVLGFWLSADMLRSVLGLPDMLLGLPSVIGGVSAFAWAIVKEAEEAVAVMRIPIKSDEAKGIVCRHSGRSTPMGFCWSRPRALGLGPVPLVSALCP